MYVLALIIHIIVSLFLIFIILIQSSKGEGISDVFGGGSSQTTIFGTRTGTFLTKATTASAIVFMVTSLSLTLLSRQKAGSVIQQELIKQQVKEKVEKFLSKPEKKEAAKEPTKPQEEVTLPVAPETQPSQEEKTTVKP